MIKLLYGQSIRCFWCFILFFYKCKLTNSGFVMITRIWNYYRFIIRNISNKLEDYISNVLSNLQCETFQLWLNTSFKDQKPLFIQQKLVSGHSGKEASKRSFVVLLTNLRGNQKPLIGIQIIWILVRKHEKLKNIICRTGMYVYDLLLYKCFNR